MAFSCFPLAGGSSDSLTGLNRVWDTELGRRTPWLGTTYFPSREDLYGSSILWDGRVESDTNAAVL